MKTKRRQSSRHLKRVTEVDEATIRLPIEPLAEGRSVMEAVEIAQGLTRKIAESCLEHGDPLPPALAGLRRAPLELVVPVVVR